ncbi:MAG: lysylphosphatidylglycerol synthase domain-containing protein [Gaiellaceae bacterium]|jgi:uncharacterized membrane protein YbhN (UPF0104 family)
MRPIGIVVAALSLLALGWLLAPTAFVGRQLRDAPDAVAAAQPLWLWAAGAGFVLAVVCAGCAWRSAFRLCGGNMGRVDACARYGAGSLVNSLLPFNIGGACRVVLFSRALPADQRLWVAGGVPAAVGAGRALLMSVLVLAAAGSAALPAWTALVLLAVGSAAAAVCLWARHRCAGTGRLSHLLDVFAALGRSPRGALTMLGWLAASVAARVVAVASVSAAVGLTAPLSTALVLVPALAVATLVSLSPAGIGVTSGAVALVLHQRGVDVTTALGAGLALNVVEAAAGLATGIASGLILASQGVPARRRTLVLAGAAACLVAAAFGVAGFIA